MQLVTKLRFYVLGSNNMLFWRISSEKITDLGIKQNELETSIGFKKSAKTGCYVGKESWYMIKNQ